MSALRFPVEQAFGALKRGYGFYRARYLGLVRIRNHALLLVPAFNLRKSVRPAAVSRMMLSTTYFGICLITFELPRKIFEKNRYVFRALWGGEKVSPAANRPAEPPGTSTERKASRETS